MRSISGIFPRLTRLGPSPTATWDSWFKWMQRPSWSSDIREHGGVFLMPVTTTLEFPAVTDTPKAILTALGRATLLVRDQDEALAFYCEKLGFEVLYDGRNPDGFRALHIGLPGQRQEPRVGLWLIPARSDEELALVGRQSGRE